MGVAIKKLFEKEETSFKKLKGKILAVDAYNMLFQFLTTIRQYDGTPLKDKGGTTSHLSGILYRLSKLIKNDIKLIFVYDGKSPEFKQGEKDRRKEKKMKAMEKYKVAKKENNIKEMKKYSKRTTKLTSEIIEESKEALDAFGIPYIDAPSEGEAQASYLVKNGDAYACLTQDFDALMFGANRVIRNLSITGRRKIGNRYVDIKPEIINLKSNLNRLEITQEELIIIGMLKGTDYNHKGIPRIGPKRGLKLVKEHDNPEDIFKEVEWDKHFDISWKEILDFFKNPPIKKEFNYKFKDINEKKLKEIYCKKHEFSEDRINKIIKEIKKSQQQSDLRDWF